MAGIPWNKGLTLGPLSEITRRRIGDANRGHVHTEEHKNKISRTLKALHRLPWNAGKHLPAAMRAKIAAAGIGKRHSEETKQKMRAYQLANTAPSRKPLNLIIRNSTKYAEWRKAVFDRDDYRCFDCGNRSGEVGHTLVLEAHHIYAFAVFPRLRLVLDNGITLCRKCHDMTKIKGPRTYSFSVQ